MKRLLHLYRRPGKRQVANVPVGSGVGAWPALEPVDAGARFGKRKMLRVLLASSCGARLPDSVGFSLVSALRLRPGISISFLGQPEPRLLFLICFRFCSAWCSHRCNSSTPLSRASAQPGALPDGPGQAATNIYCSFFPCLQQAF